MKNRMVLLPIAALLILTISGCAVQVDDLSGTASDAVSVEVDGRTVNDVTAEHIYHVNIGGNARSIVIRQGENEYFEFHNGDLDMDHTYKVLCNENGDTMDIDIMMENAKDDNNILGSFVIDIPQKEFETIEVTGGFRQVSLYTVNSDVTVHANGSFVNLDVEADHLEHDITLNGSGSDTFKGVSVYLDKFPENVKMELNLLPDGTINDPQNILTENGLESGSGKPVISIDHTKVINIYRKE